MPKSKAPVEDRILAEAAINVMISQDPEFEAKLAAESDEIIFAGLIIDAPEARNIMAIFLQFGTHLMQAQKAVTEAQFTHLMGDCLNPDNFVQGIQVAH